MLEVSNRPYNSTEELENTSQRRRRTGSLPPPGVSYGSLGSEKNEWDSFEEEGTEC